MAGIQADQQLAPQNYLVNAAAQMGAFGGQAAGQSGQAGMAGGDARAAGIVGVGNAVSGGLQNYYNNQLWQQLIAQQQPSYGGVGQSQGVDISAGGGFTP